MSYSWNELKPDHHPRRANHNSTVPRFRAFFLARRRESTNLNKRVYRRSPMSEPSRLSHFDSTGQAAMVDVSAKQDSLRSATATAFVELSSAVLAALPANPKGNPLEVARFAGIQAAKRTSDLIPMCHPLPLTHVDVQAEVVHGGVRITATAVTVGPTGVEMEALTAAAVAALTVYDMTKALDKGIVIRNIQLEAKSGGKSGDFARVHDRV
jgi:cyclic pyranopterin phosphate synthase